MPYGTLANGADGIKNAITSFDAARKSDIENERLPPELFEAGQEPLDDQINEEDEEDEHADEGGEAAGHEGTGVGAIGGVAAEEEETDTFDDAPYSSPVPDSGAGGPVTSPVSSRTHVSHRRFGSTSSITGATSGGSSVPSTPAEGSVPGTPVGSVPQSPSNTTRKPGHRRNSSLGTTMTSSPSMRRRSLETTMELIRAAIGGGATPATKEVLTHYYYCCC